MRLFTSLRETPSSTPFSWRSRQETNLLSSQLVRDVAGYEEGAALIRRVLLVLHIERALVEVKAGRLMNSGGDVRPRLSPKSVREHDALVVVVISSGASRYGLIEVEFICVGGRYQARYEDHHAQGQQ